MEHEALQGAHPGGFTTDILPRVLLRLERGLELNFARRL